MINLLKYFLSIAFLISSSFPVSGQNDEITRLKSDYPKCVERFPIDKQPATYVFAIDFSTSMISLENVVKNNLRLFINSLPDGDKITLIREGETANTDFIYLPNAPISVQSRASIISNLNSVRFDQNASDGYKLAEKIIEAIDQTGGNDLIYVFIFTDFEYYTTTNGYDKNKCDWEKLASKFSAIEKGKRIIKAGLELPASGLKPGAIFKTDLDKVFNGVNFYRVVDSNSLSAWFADTRANILRDRFKFVVEKVIDEEIKGVEFHMRPVSGLKPETWTKCENCELISSFSFLSPPELLKSSRPLIGCFTKAQIMDGKIIPIFNSTFEHTAGYNEVDKLVQDSKEKNVRIILHKPDAVIPCWFFLILILIILAFITCSVITCLGKKMFNALHINAEWQSNNKYETVSKSISALKRVLIGSDSDSKGVNVFLIPGVSKQIEIYYRHICPCKVWIKPGAYIRVNKGNNIKYTIMGKREQRALMAGSVEYLASYNNFMGVVIEFDDNNVHYTIKVRK